MNKVQTITNALIAANGELVDDHTRSASVVKHFGHFIARNGAEYVVPLYKDYFCINHINVKDDGGIHLSTFSVGGLVNAKDYDIIEACERYNESNAGSHFTAVYEIISAGESKITLLETSK